MAELEDAPDLGSGAERRGGSTPPFRTDESAAATGGAPPIKSDGDLSRRMTLTFPATEVDGTLAVRLREFGKTVNIRGFRPGKIPQKVLRQRFGKQALYDILSKRAETKFNEIIIAQQRRISPHLRVEPAFVGSPDYDVVCFFDDLPEVSPPDFNGKRLLHPTLTIGDAEVDRMISRLQRDRAIFSAVERPTQDDDIVTLDFDGAIDGEPFNGGSARDFVARLGHKQLLEPFEQEILGTRAGEEKSAEIEFPADYAAEQLRGKRAQFLIKIKSVREPSLPPLNADFARLFGVENGDMGVFRERVRADLDREAKDRLATLTRLRALDLLMKATPDFPLPRTLVDAEIEAMIADARAEFARRRLSPERINPSAFEQRALLKVRLGLAVAAFQIREKIEVGEDEVESKLKAFAEAYEDPAAFIANCKADKTRMRYLKASLEEDRVAGQVAAVAESEDSPIDFAELMGEGNV